MEINELISPEDIVANLKSTSKKQALQELAKRVAAASGENKRGSFDVLMERERLGTTGVGNGIAIPHGKLKKITRLYGLFAPAAVRRRPLRPGCCTPAGRLDAL